jgi:hypothetical protein
MIRSDAPEKRFQMLTVSYCRRKLKHELIVMMPQANMYAPVGCDESYPIG